MTDCKVFPANGTAATTRGYARCQTNKRERDMDGLIYLIGLVVVILAILSFFGLR